MSSSPNQVLGVIPARWGSTRFPGKPLHLIAGKPLIQHVWERCQECARLSIVTVATDDERIANAVRDFGGQVTMTSPDHPSGTDRAAEVAAAFPEASHILNIQGDEPLIDPGLIDSLAGALLADPALPMITAANPLFASDPLPHRSQCRKSNDHRRRTCPLLFAEPHPPSAQGSGRSPLLPAQRDLRISARFSF